jgi:hypothetical protein
MNPSIPYNAPIYTLLEYSLNRRFICDIRGPNKGCDEMHSKVVLLNVKSDLEWPSYSKVVLFNDLGWYVSLHKIEFTFGSMVIGCIHVRQQIKAINIK